MKWYYGRLHIPPLTVNVCCGHVLPSIADRHGSRDRQLVWGRGEKRHAPRAAPRNAKPKRKPFAMGTPVFSYLASYCVTLVVDFSSRYTPISECPIVPSTVLTFPPSLPHSNCTGALPYSANQPGGDSAPTPWEGVRWIHGGYRKRYLAGESTQPEQQRKCTCLASVSMSARTHMHIHFVHNIPLVVFDTR